QPRFSTRFALYLSNSLPLAASRPQLSQRPVASNSSAPYAHPFQTTFPLPEGNPHVLRTLRLTNLSQTPCLHSLRRGSHVSTVPTGQPLHSFSRGTLQLSCCVAALAAPGLRSPRGNLFPRVALAF